MAGWTNVLRDLDRMESKNAIMKVASATPKKPHSSSVIAASKRLKLKIPLNHHSSIETPSPTEEKFTFPTHAQRPKTLSLLPTIVEINEVKGDNDVVDNTIDNEQGEDKDVGGCVGVNLWGSTLTDVWPI